MVRLLRDYKIVDVNTQDQIDSLKSYTECGYELVGGAYLGREGSPRQAIALYETVEPEQKKKNWLEKLFT